MKIPRTDSLVSEMERFGIPVTKGNYLKLALFGNPPEMLTAEHLADLPEQFQDEQNEDEPEGV